MDCLVHGVAKNQTRLSDFHSYLLLYLSRVLGELNGRCIYMLSVYMEIDFKSTECIGSRIRLTRLTFYPHQLKTV